MTITNEWLGSNGTGRGAWTCSQLKLIGVPWPPPRGWRREVVGMEISDDAAREFELIGRYNREQRERVNAANFWS